MNINIFLLDYAHLLFITSAMLTSTFKFLCVYMFLLHRLLNNFTPQALTFLLPVFTKAQNCNLGTTMIWRIRIHEQKETKTHSSSHCLMLGTLDLNCLSFRTGVGLVLGEIYSVGHLHYVRSFSGPDAQMPYESLPWRL